MAKVNATDTVLVHYTGTLDNGETFDSSIEREPLEFTLGSQQVIPGFESAVLGMDIGDKKKVVIPSAEAYGEKRDDLIIQVGRDRFVQGRDPEIGLRVYLPTENSRIPATVTSFDDENVTLDANHPLAGENLTFEIELVQILDGPTEHTCTGCGGCH